MMLTQPAEVLVAFMQSQGIAIRPDGTTLGWQAFKGMQPTTPDDTIVCYNDEPDLQGKTLKDGELLIKPRVVVHVRSKSSDRAWQKCAEIINALSAAIRVELNCRTTDGTEGQTVLLKNVTTIVAPKSWMVQEEANRRVYFSFTVQLTASEVS